MPYHFDSACWQYAKNAAKQCIDYLQVKIFGINKPHHTTINEVVLRERKVGVEFLRLQWFVSSLIVSTCCW